MVDISFLSAHPEEEEIIQSAKSKWLTIDIAKTLTYTRNGKNITRHYIRVEEVAK